MKSHLELQIRFQDEMNVTVVWNGIKTKLPKWSSEFFIALFMAICTKTIRTEKGLNDAVYKSKTQIQKKVT